MSRFLLDRLPGLAAILEPVPLGRWPTPVQRVVGLAEAPELWIKRDDLSAELYGGSKIRNLEWILGDARRRKKRTLLCTGAWGSHLALSLGLYGEAHGFTVRCVLVPQLEDDEVRSNASRLAATGAEVARLGTALHWPTSWLQHRFRRAADVYWVAPGGASPVGSLGLVAAALELAAQIRSGDLPKPDFIYCAVGSGGTLIGLAQGLALAGLEATLVGVRVVPRIASALPRRAVMAHRLRRLLERSGAPIPAPHPVVISHDFVGRGYGCPTEFGAAAARRLAEHGGPRLEPVYTEKTFAGLLSFVATQGLAGRTHLFWNTFDSRLAPNPASRPQA